MQKNRIAKKLARRLKILGIRTVAAVGEGANPGGKILSVKDKGGLPMQGVLNILQKGVSKIGEEGQKLLEEALEGAPDMVRAQVMAAMAMLLRDQAAKPVPAPESEPAGKPEAALPDTDALKPVAAQAPNEEPKKEEDDMGLKEELEKANAEKEETRKELDAIKVAKAKEEIIEVVKSFGRVPGDTEKTAELLQVVKSKCGDATYSQLVDTLVKADGLIAAGGERGLLTPDPKDGAGDGAEFIQVVKSLSGGKDGVTEELAMAMAAKSHPRLYEAWAETQRSQ